MITASKPQSRTCRECNQRKHPAFFRVHSTLCRLCVETHEKRVINPMDYLVCELFVSDGKWHIKRKTSVNTYCRKPSYLPPFVAQGPSELLALRDEPACCRKRREKLVRMFEEGE